MDVYGAASIKKIYTSEKGYLSIEFDVVSLF